MSLAPLRPSLGSSRKWVFAGIEEIMDDAREGRMFVIVDGDEDRHGEGNLVIPAQMATPDAVNFMARYGRGLICLALTKVRVDQLGLNLMQARDERQANVAFTVSIEAREGVTTGISAADRARTVSVAIDGSKGAEDIVTPGHVFPLIAREGGVLIRAGHTEAAVDIPRLAGLNPSGVICRVMRTDGTIAQIDDLVVLAREHGLKIGTIRDLIAYRRRHDHLVEAVTVSDFYSEYGGQWQAIVYRNKLDDCESLVLQKGPIAADSPTLVRVHNTSLAHDILGVPGGRNRLLQRSMMEIAREGRGVIVILTPADPERGRISRHLRRQPGDMDLRAYGIGAQILADLGIHEMILLSNTRQALVALEGYGLSIIGQHPITGEEA